MNILYALLIILIVHPTVGTLLFAYVENLRTSTKVKISIMTFGHPLLTAIIIWFACPIFNKEIAETAALFVAGTLLRLPFSQRKYFSTVVKESGAVTIEYFSELLIRKTIRLTTSEITDFKQLVSRHLIDKPSEMTVTIVNQTMKFILLDKTTKVSL
ncbi:hypothetical protein IQ13_4218 [Lacibacter cauensis]|uniref:Uncharacterized protein n=1 Tax=Lacibacter cauensis TaxID=510947 RepID=A0A562S9B0_9BACT|nr:hypothetical protein [Lacibacter cauensis]TWI77975.1 hypothetical protein IQ13_4218 [Lacibacter cauensis]